MVAVMMVISGGAAGACLSGMIMALIHGDGGMALMRGVMLGVNAAFVLYWHSYMALRK